MMISRMSELYRNAAKLPSLTAFLFLAACEQAMPPTQQTTEAIPNADLEALQDAEALRATSQDRQDQESRIDALLGRTPDDRR